MNNLTHYTPVVRHHDFPFEQVSNIDQLPSPQSKSYPFMIRGQIGETPNRTERQMVRFTGLILFYDMNLDSYEGRYLFTLILAGKQILWNLRF